MNPKLTPIATIGDIVILGGYGRRLFRVDGYTHEFMYDEDGPNEDIWYDVACVITGEYTIGAHDDIKLACKEDHATPFIANYEHPLTPSLLSGIETISFTMSASDTPAVVTPKAKPKKRHEKQAIVDDLLDEYRDLLMQTELFGETDSNYSEMIAEVEAKLQEATK